eukprot:CAMPEP_0185612444 /NCGR_PEP_ID=MMETSP0436-20130131/21737_1 /TAXON_ID=626734 ORGANISM="Favella taraikaensis, Strain Fe Narragansett Bay" /NCGR_SAMPLE_ID=MMETSP0436 /ASSEMBLY_ACC=CAM_ASM_000390 /LENGTH=32 /DNA_ID= /DNA_START= /DNA_END= /DNA_ORIENTATION=
MTMSELESFDPTKSHQIGTRHKQLHRVKGTEK